MKKFITVSTVALMLIFATVALAQTDLPGSGWWSGETIMNVGGSTETIMVTAYDKNSSDTFVAQEDVAPGAYFNFTPNDFTGMPSGFQGSAVVSSGAPIKAVVNVTNRLAGGFGVTGGLAAAQYQGIDGSMTDTTLYIPIAKGDYYGKTTTYYIQNAGATPTTLSVTFKMKNGSTHSYTSPSVGPNKMVLFSVFDTPTYSPGSNPDSRVGAVTIVSDAGTDIAGVVMEHKTSENPATLAQGTRGFTSADFSDKAYAPIIKNTYYLRSTGIQVQNVGGSPINIKVTYVGYNDGPCKNKTYSDTQTNIQPGASAIFNQMPGQTNLPNGCGASAMIESTTAGGQIVALVSESYYSTMVPATGQRSVTSFAIPANTATTKAVAPLFKDDTYSKRTGMLIQNVGTVQATNVVTTFVCSGPGGSFTAVSKPETINAGAGLQWYTPSDEPARFESGKTFATNDVLCSTTVTADQPIVILANESVIPPSDGGTFNQDNNNYEGFNLEP
jgi:hypothetical protein